MSAHGRGPSARQLKNELTAEAIDEAIMDWLLDGPATGGNLSRAVGITPKLCAEHLGALRDADKVELTTVKDTYFWKVVDG